RGERHPGHLLVADDFLDLQDVDPEVVIIQEERAVLAIIDHGSAPRDTGWLGRPDDLLQVQELGYPVLNHGSEQNARTSGARPGRDRLLDDVEDAADDEPDLAVRPGVDDNLDRLPFRPGGVLPLHPP